MDVLRGYLLHQLMVDVASQSCVASLPRLHLHLTVDCSAVQCASMLRACADVSQFMVQLEVGKVLHLVALTELPLMPM